MLLFFLFVIRNNNDNNNNDNNKAKCLFDMIKQLPTPLDKAFIREEKRGNTLLINFTLFKIPEKIPVVSTGFKAMMHYGGYGDKRGQEIAIELNKIEKSIMIKKMETKKIVVTTEKCIDVGINSRIIIRYSTDTLGFGTVLGVKSS